MSNDREPIIVGLTPAAIALLVAAIANVLRAFGIADVTQGQVDSINAAAVAIATIGGAIGAWWARRRSTPVAAPQLPTGTQVVVTTPEGNPSHTETLR